MKKTISGRSGFQLGLYIVIILLTMTLLPTENVSAQDSQPTNDYRNKSSLKTFGQIL